MEATLDLLRVDRTSDLPLGTQIAWQLRAMIASGKLAPGDRLPSVRELAERADVNPNTARAIYARLEGDGLVASRHGLGTFVASDLRSSAEVERIAADAVAQARRAGVSAADVARVIFAAGWARDEPGERGAAPSDVGLAADQAAARRELRRQIARIEAELAAYPETRSDRNRHPLLRPKGNVASFAELAAVRDEMLDLLRRARRRAAAKGRASVSRAQDA